MKTVAFPRPVGDIAGTHACFAMVLDAEQGVQDVGLYQADRYDSLGAERLLVLNDFAALARVLPVLSAAERRRIGTGMGLEVAGLMPSPDGSAHWPINGEGGHVTLQSHDPDEMEVLSVSRRRFGHVSAERALSDAGLVNLHPALCALHVRPTPRLNLAAISCVSRS